MKTDEYTLTPLQQLVYEIVAEIIEAKQGVVEPCLAHINEIRNSMNVELMEALRGMCRNGIVSVHMDINKNPQFQIKQPIQ